MKICLFGSSFNPPHIAHLEIVNELKKQSFDKLLLVPTGNPNHKKIDISTADRVELIDAFATLTGVEVTYHEIDHDFEYTVESIKYLNFSAEDQIYFTIGGDSVNTLPEWDYYDLLKTMVTFIVFDRPGVVLDEQVLADISYIKLELATTNISSSELRKNLNQELIPQPIFDIIQRKKLYIK